MYVCISFLCEFMYIVGKEINISKYKILGNHKVSKF